MQANGDMLNIYCEGGKGDNILKDLIFGNL